MSARVRVHAYGTESGPYTRPCTGIIRALYSWGLSLGAACTCARTVLCVCVCVCVAKSFSGSRSVLLSLSCCPVFSLSFSFSSAYLYMYVRVCWEHKGVHVYTRTRALASPGLTGLHVCVARWRSRERCPRDYVYMCVRARIRESGINPGLLVVCAPPAVQIQNPTHTTQLIPTPLPPFRLHLVALTSLPSLGVSCVCSTDGTKRSLQGVSESARPPIFAIRIDRGSLKILVNLRLTEVPVIVADSLFISKDDVNLGKMRRYQSFKDFPLLNVPALRRSMSLIFCIVLCINGYFIYIICDKRKRIEVERVKNAGH